MSLQRLVLWRHGETDYNAESRMQGQMDSRLTSRGLGQARRASRVLAGLRPDVLMSSDLSRAANTAAVLAAELDMPVLLDKRLRETDLGEWQGRTHADVEAECPGAIMMWRSNPEWAPPAGETRIDVAGRAARLIAELDASDHRTALLCTHGGLISGLTPLLLELPLTHWPVFVGIGNCQWTVLVRRRLIGRGTGWRLESYNTGVSSWGDATDRVMTPRATRNNAT